MRFNSIFAMLMLSASIPAVATDFDLKGIYLGQMPTKQSRQTLGETKLAGARASITYFNGPHGAIDEIDAFFNAVDFPAVSAAFVAKYGQPSDVKRTSMQNAFGARFERVEELWTNSNGDMIQLVNFLSAERGCVRLIDRKRLDAQAVSDKKAKGDI